MRLENRVAMVVGGGQTPGEAIGNGRATALTFAREGARVAVLDRDLSSAQDTVAMIAENGGAATAIACDITDEKTIIDAVAETMSSYGRIDILHNNVGVSLQGGDGPMLTITEEAFDRVMAINLRGMVITCKHVVPIMREQEAGVIINISSIAAINVYPNIAYKTSKAGMIAFTTQLAMENAKYGIRANTILPGLMDTSMAVDTRARLSNRPREEIKAERDSKVPLKGGMGTGWDIANAALFLASDEARFITAVALPVDGGNSARVN
jgi:NAD(P)-dependent dehydrogenase (short-subunit alcohol dehydrogenase family)